MARSRVTAHRPSTLKSLHEVAPQSSYLLSGGLPVHDQLLQHSRYVRDYLMPLLELHELPTSEVEVLSSIIRHLLRVPMDLSLLRYSRIEKALQAIVDSDGMGWPTDVVTQSRQILRRWELLLQMSMENIPADLLRPGGRLDGLRCVSLDTCQLRGDIVRRLNCRMI